MKKLSLACVSLLWVSNLVFAGSNSKTETVEEQEKSEVKVFCSKNSEKEAVSACQKWLDAQVKTLGPRLLTSYCGEGELQTANSGCLYKATGELKYVLKKFKTETEKSN